MPGTRLIDRFVQVVALHGVTPSSSSPKWVSLKGYNHVTAMITFKNATTVTGSAIGLQQATAVAGTGAKVLPFAAYSSNIDDAASVALAPQVAAGNTFTTDPTNSKTGLYIIEVDADDLDVNNGFDCFQVTTGNGVATTIEVTYFLSGSRYGGSSYGYANPLAD